MNERVLVFTQTLINSKQDAGQTVSRMMLDEKALEFSKHVLNALCYAVLLKPGDKGWKRHLCLC